MLFKIRILNAEIWVGKSFIGFSYLPKFIWCKPDTVFSWLGGNIVWSRLKRTSKDTDRV